VWQVARVVPDQQTFTRPGYPNDIAPLPTPQRVVARPHNREQAPRPDGYLVRPERDRVSNVLGLIHKRARCIVEELTKADCDLGGEDDDE
jgi:hypothetical protein